MILDSITIGVLIKELDGTFQKQIVDSLIEEAQELDVALVFFPGNDLSTQYRYVEQFNAIYTFAKSSRIDAILSVTNSFNARQEPAFVQQMLADYKKPVLSLGMPFPGITGVVQDNAIGLTALMEHLIQVHGYRRFAFMQGPLLNIDAEVRFQTFRNCLASAGIAFDPELVTTGNFDHYDGSVAMRKLLDQGKPFDVLVAANDEMALAAMSVAAERGYRVPQDFAITGFDDLLSLSKTGSLLTTVHQPISAQVNKGLRYLLMQLRGEAIPPLIEVQTYPVIRQSCGCLAGSTPHHPPEFSVRGDHDMIIAELNLQNAEAAPYHVWLDTLQLALFSNDDRAFDAALDAAAKSSWQQSGEISALQLLLLGMLKHLLKPGERSATDIAHYAARLQKGQILLANALSTQHAQENFMQWSNQRSLSGFLKMGMINFDQQELVSILHNTLKRIGIPTCYVALYEYSLAYKSMRDFVPPKHSKLILAQVNHVRRFDLEDVPFVTERLIPDSGASTALLADSSNTMKVGALGMFPIFQHNQHFGYMLIEILDKPKLSAEQIRDEVSTTLTGALLVTELALARDLLRQDLDLATERNERLELLTEIDELTGLYNRRGFYEHAERSISTRTPYPVILIFADLDGLKQINDQYGHAEGDFAIKSAGEVLRFAFRTSDIICRLGGDEFVVLSLKCRPHELANIRERVYAHFDKFNTTSEKPYAVCCSLGYCVIDQDNNQPLATLLDQADQYLYAEKLRRKTLRPTER